jgi:hypothetical protein
MLQRRSLQCTIWTWTPPPKNQCISAVRRNSRHPYYHPNTPTGWVHPALYTHTLAWRDLLRTETITAPSTARPVYNQHDQTPYQVLIRTESVLTSIYVHISLAYNFFHNLSILFQIEYFFGTQTFILYSPDGGLEDILVHMVHYLSWLVYKITLFI